MKNIVYDVSFELQKVNNLKKSLPVEILIICWILH